MKQAHDWALLLWHHKQYAAALSKCCFALEHLLGSTVQPGQLLEDVDVAEVARDMAGFDHRGVWRQGVVEEAHAEVMRLVELMLIVLGPVRWLVALLYS